ncbi:hypothetical protein [Deinococcus ruber]|uniref:Uncharacterized protein n=1 Tax=Deinococcus ruber TaxID=1848197 RepID=A0A918CDM9_9DEIO|nr:hypothetical protein [Deinococcus ruber]GGR17026.1 hypothetical protein GCM10008957_32090 [Deinococcus ruber]
MSLLKARIPALQGWRVLVLSFLLSEVGSYLLFLAGWLTDSTYTRFTPPWVWLLFGLVAFVIVSGGYNLLMQLLATRPVVAATPLPLIGATHVLYPEPGPGRIPAYADGQFIGYLTALTPSSPHLVATTTSTPPR